MDARNNGEGVGGLFRVLAMEIDSQHTPMHDQVLEAMTNLVQTGVPLSRLSLPCLERDTPNIHQWIPFVRLITGIDNTHEGKPAHVRRIEIPASYAVTTHFGSLCSALARSKGVDVFCILGGQHTLVDNSFTTHSIVRDFAWRWLAFALFSSASSTSVKALYMAVERPINTDNATIKQMIEAPDPFRLLDLTAIRKPGNIREAAHTNEIRTVTIPRRTVVRASDGIRETECQSDHDLVGEIIVSSDGDTIAFIPGYGLCRGLISERPNKRAKTQSVSTPTPVQSASSLRSIALRSKDDFEISPDSLAEFLEIFGPRLRDLELTIEVNDDILERVFQSCAKLESLSLKPATLSSMEVFERAYENGAETTSLRLKGVQVPDSSLHTFFERLAVVSPHKKTAAYELERLYYDFNRKSATPPETNQLLESILQQNTNLTHFTGMVAVARLSFLEDPPFASYHGQFIPRLPSAQKKQLLALLGGLRVLAKAKPHLFLDTHVMKHILRYVFAPRYRYVDWFRNTTISH